MGERICTEVKKFENDLHHVNNVSQTSPHDCISDFYKEEISLVMLQIVIYILMNKCFIFYSKRFEKFLIQYFVFQSSF